MQVYKAFLKISIKMIPAIIAYVVVFFVIIMLLSSMTTGTATDYAQSKAEIFIIDEDNTPESKALSDYLAAKHELVDMPEDYDDELLQDNLYYRQIEYILTIKNGYGERIAAGETEGLFEKSCVPSTFATIYVENDITQYISTLSMYITSGESVEEAIASTTALLGEKSVDVVLENFGDESSNLSLSCYMYFLYLPYIFPSIIIGGIVPVLVTLAKKDTKNRIACSPISVSSMMVQTILGVVTVCLVLWVVFVGGAIIRFGSEVFSSYGLLSIANSLMCMCSSSGIAILIAQIFNRSDFFLSMVNNIYSLGSSFLCGVFVPQSLLGDGVTAVSKFLPTFWYVKAQDILGGGEAFELNNILICFAVQVAFALVFFISALLVAKLKRNAGA